MAVLTVLAIALPCLAVYGVARVIADAAVKLASLRVEAREVELSEDVREQLRAMGERVDAAEAKARDAANAAQMRRR